MLLLTFSLSLTTAWQFHSLGIGYFWWVFFFSSFTTYYKHNLITFWGTNNRFKKYIKASSRGVTVGEEHPRSPKHPARTEWAENQVATRRAGQKECPNFTSVCHLDSVLRMISLGCFLPLSQTILSKSRLAMSQYILGISDFPTYSSFEILLCF